MEYISVKEAAIKWQISERRVQYFCANNKIPGAKSMGKQWIIPMEAEKPMDGRSRKAKLSHNEGTYHFPMLTHSPMYAKQSLLNDEELILLKAQDLYLQGKHLESISICRSLISTTKSRTIIFGSYVTMCINFDLLGITYELNACLKKLKKMADEETEHQEDFRFLIAGIIFHNTLNAKPLLGIDIDKLSDDALYSFEALVLLSDTLNEVKVSQNQLLFYSGYLKKLKYEGIDALVIGLSFLIGLQTVKYRKVEASPKLYIDACALAIKNNWISFLSKYYQLDNVKISECLDRNFGHEYLVSLDEACKVNFNNWKFVNSKVTDKSLPYPMALREYVLLAGSGLTNEEIQLATGKSLSEIEDIFNTIITKAGLSSREELVQKSKELL